MSSKDYADLLEQRALGDAPCVPNALTTQIFDKLPCADSYKKFEPSFALAFDGVIY